MSIQSGSRRAKPLALMAPAPALGWAATRLGTPSLLWARPAEGVFAVGFGVAEAREAHDEWETRALLEELTSERGDVECRGPEGTPATSRWFGGLAFDLRGPAWPGWPQSRWIRPGALFWQEQGRAYLAVEGFEADEPAMRARLDDLGGRLASLKPEPGESDETIPERSVIEEDEGDYRRLVEQALAAIGGERAQKIVAARRLLVSAPSAFEPVRSLQRLANALPTTTLFLVRGNRGDSFVGASPETLCEISGGVVRTEALAGTAAAGSAKALIESDKDRREHLSVVAAISGALARLGEEVHVDREPQLRGFGGIVHLRTAIHARLALGSSVAQVVLALHPTPAVGGTPRGVALSLLREHEGWPRGWYGGAIGWIGPGQANLRVGIRSALVEGTRAQVFVGAGIVRGSTPDGEWAETAAKSVPMLKALGGLR